MSDYDSNHAAERSTSAHPTICSSPLKVKNTSQGFVRPVDALFSLSEDIVPSESSYSIMPVEHASELSIAISSDATLTCDEIVIWPYEQGVSPYSAASGLTSKVDLTLP